MFGLRGLVRLFGVLALLGAIGCAAPNGELARPDLSKRPARAVVTTSMIADLVRQVGGAYVEVAALMKPGIDPHQYRASAGDQARMQEADIVFYNGLHLEGKMADVFEKMAGRVRTVAVTKGLDPERDLRRADGEFDPHVWFDVSLWMKSIDVVRDALAELDPAHAAAYRANADRHRAELAALHEEVRQKAQRVPSDRRVLITAHDAFAYFGRAYGFEVRGLQGISTVAEPSLQDVKELAQFIAGRKIPAIFGETSVPDRNIQAVQEAVRRGWGYEVKFLGGKLYSDSLGDEGGPAGTYAGMVRHNVDTIVDALGG